MIFKHAKIVALFPLIYILAVEITLVKISKIIAAEMLPHLLKNEIDYLHAIFLEAYCNMVIISHSTPHIYFTHGNSSDRFNYAR